MQHRLLRSDFRAQASIAHDYGFYNSSVFHAGLVLCLLVSLMSRCLRVDASMTAAAVTLRRQSHLALPFADSGTTAAFVLVGLSCPAFPLLTMRCCLDVVPADRRPDNGRPRRVLDSRRAAGESATRQLLSPVLALPRSGAGISVARGRFSSRGNALRSNRIHAPGQEIMSKARLDGPKTLDDNVSGR